MTTPSRLLVAKLQAASTAAACNAVGCKAAGCKAASLNVFLQKLFKTLMGRRSWVFGLGSPRGSSLFLIGGSLTARYFTPGFQFSKLSVNGGFPSVRDLL